MSNALRNAAESTAHVLSDLVDEARDLVDEARDRIEDLPPLRARRHSGNRRWVVMAVVAAVLMVILVGRRRSREHPEVSDSSAGARLMEKSLAVS
jgi:uncharacterized MAPEG superfamily protein